MSRFKMIVKNLTKSYGNVPLIKELDNEFSCGTHAIVGPNSIGKSTLLTLLAGSCKPERGEISIDGINLFYEPLAYKRLISFVPDKPIIYPYITGNEFLYFVSSLRNEKYDKAYFAELIKKFDIEDFLKVEFRSMSLGTQKKFFIVAALISKSKVLLMDEPTNVIDVNAKEKLTEIVNLLKSERIVIFSTHDQEFIEKTEASKHQLAGCNAIDRFLGLVN